MLARSLLKLQTKLRQGLLLALSPPAWRIPRRSLSYSGSIVVPLVKLHRVFLVLAVNYIYANRQTATCNIRIFRRRDASQTHVSYKRIFFHFSPERKGTNSFYTCYLWSKTKENEKPDCIIVHFSIFSIFIAIDIFITRNAKEKHLGSNFFASDILYMWCPRFSLIYI